jgi:hypothetical protein
MQAIITKYLGPTDHRGARVKATADAGTVTVSWDHALNTEDNHRAAAEALANEYRWLDGGDWKLVGGSLPDGTGFAFVLVRAPKADRWNLED